MTLRSIARETLAWPARVAWRVRRRGIQAASPEGVVLSFGGVLDAKRLVHGGAVKLLGLREHFPTDDRNFHILYLVSSAQAAFAEDLVRTCRKRGIRFVWNQNGVGYPGWAGADAERHNTGMRRLRAQADFVIYQSAFCRLCAEKFLGPAEAPSTVLFNPVDVERFRPSTQTPQDGPLRLLAMGTQNYRDRVLSTIACLRALRAKGIVCTLTIAGKFLWRNAEADVRAAVADAGLRDAVTLRPAFSQADAPEIYRAHDILLHPKYLDPCPTVVLEALACGLPVVGSASGGMPELVTPACGQLIEVPQVWDRLITPSGEELAEAVREIVPRLAAMQTAARQRAESVFAASTWVRSHAEIFNRLLA